MAKRKTFFLRSLLFVFLFMSGIRQLQSASWLGVDMGLGAHTASERPFNAFPLIEVGFHHAFSGAWALGGTLAFTKWSDYLNMYGGKYTFYCLRPAIGLTYFFPAILSSIVTPLAGIAIGYNFYRIKNELGNPYPGDLQDHVFFTPHLGANFSPWRKVRGFAKNIFLSVRLDWDVSGDFSGVHGALGLGVKIK